MSRALMAWIMGPARPRLCSVRSSRDVRPASVASWPSASGETQWSSAAAVACRDAHQQRIDRGARAPRKQWRRRPMVHGDAERNRLYPFDADRSHVASTRPAFDRLCEIRRNLARDTAMPEAETATAPRHSEVFDLALGDFESRVKRSTSRRALRIHV